MRLNPPNAIRVAILYRAWATTQRTELWEALGKFLFDLAAEKGGWKEVHQLCADCLPRIPIHHIAAAFTDHKNRALMQLIHLN